MCGRYAVGYGPRTVRHRLISAGLPVDQHPVDEEEGNDDIRRHFNVAPGNVEMVYRAVPAAEGSDEESDGVSHVLENMKWGLIPSWTKKRPAYSGLMKTINCRSDSLQEKRGMWSMRDTKRCVVIAMGFYEWLHKGKEKLPHFVKRADGELMLFAGLWDCVQFEGSAEKLYTYTIITTESNSQLSFLHNRMPVILEPDEVRTWLTPVTAWNAQLQSLLKPYAGTLEVYPVTKEVGRVGRDSPNFVIPVDSVENKSNIKNFLTPKKKKSTAVKREGGEIAKKEEEEEEGEEEGGGGSSASAKQGYPKDVVKKEDDADLAGPSTSPSVKRQRPEEAGDEELARKLTRTERPEEQGDEEFARRLLMEERAYLASLSPGVKTRSATRNKVKAGKKKEVDTGSGSKKITSFFSK